MTSLERSIFPGNISRGGKEAYSLSHKEYADELDSAEKAAAAIVANNRVNKRLQLIEPQDQLLTVRFATEKVLRIESKKDAISTKRKDHINSALEFVTATNEEMLKNNYFFGQARGIEIKAAVNDLFARQDSLQGTVLTKDMFLPDEIMKPWAETWIPRLFIATSNIA